MLGHSVKNDNDIIWNGMRQIIVYKGLLANDTIMKDKSRFNIKKWRGQNLLGFSLMQVRNDLL